MGLLYVGMKFFEVRHVPVRTKDWKIGSRFPGTFNDGEFYEYEHSEECDHEITII
jgi:hypothetical protein